MFHIGSLEIYSYAVMLVVALVVGIWLCVVQGRRRGLSADLVLDMSLYALIGGLIGTRLVFVMQNLDEYLKAPLSILNLRQGGLSYHGAVLGGVIAVILFAKRRKVSAGLLADITAVSALLGLAIGRIGCLMNGCCYGTFFEGPGAVLLPGVDGTMLPRYPVQIYEALLCIAGVAVLVNWQRIRRFDGEEFLVFTGIYSIIRFLMEYLREGHRMAGGLTLAQYASIVLLLGAALWIAAGRRAAAAQTAVIEAPPAAPAPSAAGASEAPGS